MTAQNHRLWFIRQLGSRAVTLCLVTYAVYITARLAPGDPWMIQRLGIPGSVESAGTPAGRPDFWKLTVSDYLTWAGSAASLELGHSVRDGSPIRDKLWHHFKVTLLLNTTAIAIIYLLAIPLGLLAASVASRPAGRRLDRLFSLLYSLPAFWVAMILMVLFCGGDYWHLFPVTGLRSTDITREGGVPYLLDVAWHMVLPVICLSYAGIGYVARQVRGSALECLRSQFVLLARAKGLRRRTIFARHVLPHATLPAIALLTQFFPTLLGGSVLIESIFSIPGMGLLTVDSVLARDYPVLLAIGLLSALVTLSGGLLIETYLRIRRGDWEAA